MFCTFYRKILELQWNFVDINIFYDKGFGKYALSIRCYNEIIHTPPLGIHS